MAAATSRRAAHSLDQYPERLFAQDLAEIYGVGVKQIYKLDSQGAFLFAEIRPRIGRKSWDRERIRAHFRSDLRGMTPRLRRAG